MRVCRCVGCGRAMYMRCGVWGVECRVCGGVVGGVCVWCVICDTILY